MRVRPPRQQIGNVTLGSAVVDKIPFTAGHHTWVVGDEGFVGFEFEPRAAEEFARSDSRSLGRGWSTR